MKLYLSSYRLGDHGQRLRDLVTRPGPAAIVTNACDVFEQRLMRYQRQVDDLRSLGFESCELDLRPYFGDPSALQRRLSDFALVWAVGGSAFALARAMSASGFAQAARPLVEGGDLVYAGYSAGACVAGPDLEGIDLMDDATANPTGYPPVAPVETLGWVPWRIVPHWRSDHPESAEAERVVAHLSSAGLQYRALTDGDAIIVDGHLA
jgi:dipeptidase E